MATGSLMKVESIAEYFLWSIQQYCWPALSDIGFENPFSVFFEGDSFTQV